MNQYILHHYCSANWFVKNEDGWVQHWILNLASSKYYAMRRKKNLILKLFRYISISVCSKGYLFYLFIYLFLNKPVSPCQLVSSHNNKRKRRMGTNQVVPNRLRPMRFRRLSGWTNEKAGLVAGSANSRRFRGPVSDSSSC